MIRVGIIALKLEGTMYAISGDFTLTPGGEKKEEVVGPDGTVAFKVTRIPAILEGEVRDRDNLDVKTLLELEDITATAELANGKAWVLANATQTSEGNMNLMEGTIAVRFVAERAEEIS